MTLSDNSLVTNTLGKVLIVAGVLDLAFWLWQLSSGGSYASSLNIFAIIAGVLLLRGSIRAAMIVRFFSAFLLTSLVALLVCGLFLQPIGLTLEQLKLSGIRGLWHPALLVGFAALYAWLLKHTNTAAMRESQISLGRKWRSLTIPILLGTITLMGMTLMMYRLQSSESGIKAKEMVRAKLGPEFQYYVSGWKVSNSQTSTSYSCTVTAWKRGEVQVRPFSWSEK